MPHSTHASHGTNSQLPSNWLGAESAVWRFPICSNPYPNHWAEAETLGVVEKSTLVDGRKPIFSNPTDPKRTNMAETLTAHFGFPTRFALSPRARVPFFSPKSFAWLRSLESCANGRGKKKGRTLATGKKQKKQNRSSNQQHVFHPHI